VGDLQSLKSSTLKKTNSNGSRTDFRKLRFVELELAAGILSVFDCVHYL